jgi:hypothetical protein
VSRKEVYRGMAVGETVENSTRKLSVIEIKFWIAQKY